MKKEVYFCDGCGQEVAPEKVSVVVAGIRSVDFGREENVSGHLCPECEEKLWRLFAYFVPSRLKK